MADDLKSLLNRVLSGKGSKRFYFVYGIGKRKDGAAFDGALRVGSKRLQKKDVADDCECKQVFEGDCWADPEGGTILVRGNKGPLSQMIVAKMMLTAKKELGRQYDFAVPTEADEERIDQADPVQTELDEEAGTGEVEQEEGGVPPAPPPLQTPGDSGLAEQFKAAALTAKGLIAQVAAADANKGQALSKHLAGAVAKAGAKQYEAALAQAQQAEALARSALRALAAGREIRGETPVNDAVKDNNDALAAEFKAAARTVKGLVDQVAAFDPAKGQVLTKNLTGAVALAGAKKYGTALAQVQQVEAVARGLLRAQEAAREIRGTAPTGEQPPGQPKRGKVNFAKVRLNWDAAKKKVAAQLEQLRKAALEEFPGRTSAADRLNAVLGRFNEGLGDTLSDLHVGGDGPDRDKLAEKARGVTDSYLDFVLTSELVDHVENHPFEGVTVTVRDVLLPPLKAVRQQLPD